MLKNKKAIYILIPLNLAIWSFFIYRFNTAYTDSDVPELNDKIGQIKLQEFPDSASYHLSLDYKDPFLKTEKSSRPVNFSSKADVVKKEPVKVVKTPTLTQPKSLPDIKYLGLVKNSTTGASTALIALNGNSKLVKMNDVIDGIAFKSFNKDSLVAKWGKERIVVRK